LQILASREYNGVVPGVDAASHSRDENPAIGTSNYIESRNEKITILGTVFNK
jgi:hypothetical protein